MKISKIVILFALFVGGHYKALSQTFSYQYIKLDSKTKFNSRNSKITILDNRIDTINFFSYQNGEYPLVIFSFQERASTVIGNYLATKMPNLKREILFSLKQFRVPNTRCSTSEFEQLKAKNLRYHIILETEVYINEYGKYKKLFSIKMSRVYGEYSFLAPTIKNILDEVAQITLETIAIYEKEKKHYARKANKSLLLSIFSNNLEDSGLLPVSEINVNTKSRWEKLPIFSATDSIVVGGYINFETFKNNLLKRCDLQITLDSSYGFYKVINANSQGNIQPFWAVEHRGNFYLRIIDSFYSKIDREDSCFFFHIPNSFPNMYDLLSMEQNRTKSHWLFNGSGKNLLFDIAGIGLNGLIQVLESRKKTNYSKIQNESDLFRNCVLDMDIGDVLYIH